MKTCIYCGEDKNACEFSDEHIWPDALGGDYLPDFWHTDDVCQKCNNLSGLYVDGVFIKSWAGMAERASGAHEYLSVDDPGRAVLPLHYLGKLPHPLIPADEVAEYWAGPCGANVLHFRPADEGGRWATYAGGDPRKRKKFATAGRAYIALTSTNPFWILVSLSSFRAHFKKAALFVTNLALLPQWTAFKNPDLGDPLQARDMSVITTMINAGRNGIATRVDLVVQIDLDSRLLAKLGLAVGYKMFGARFLATGYAKTLRAALWEPNLGERCGLPVRGTGYLHGPPPPGGVGATLKWPGAWVLMMRRSGEVLSLAVMAPSGRSMSVLICEEPDLMTGLDSTYENGQVWLTVPSLGEAAGPIPLPEYIAHQLQVRSVPALAALAAKRIDPSTLPPC
jgi:hypothetical protein